MTNKRKIKQIEILPAKNGWVMEATFQEPSGPDELAGCYSATDTFIFRDDEIRPHLASKVADLILEHGGAA